MKFSIKHWILVAVGIVYLYLATQSFRSQSWGVFVIDVGIVSIIGWYLLDQRRAKTDDGEKMNSNDVESANQQTKGQ